MARGFKVNIFGIIVILAIIIAIFALNRSDSAAMMKQYEDNIKVLEDTIKTLKNDIANYELEIKRIDLEREKIKKELKHIIEDNEKTDSDIANGDIDTNIEFLSDFLSEKDSLGG